MLMVKWLTTMLAAVLLAGCATSAARPDTLDAVAQDYVRLSLEAGTHEQGYIDAYYGPPEWKQAAEAAPRTVPQLIAAAAALQARVKAIAPSTDPLVRRRGGVAAAAR